jgi:hypothetical protein
MYLIDIQPPTNAMAPANNIPRNGMNALSALSTGIAMNIHIIIVNAILNSIKMDSPLYNGFEML